MDGLGNPLPWNSGYSEENRWCFRFSGAVACSFNPGSQKCQIDNIGRCAGRLFKLSDYAACIMHSRPSGLDMQCASMHNSNRRMKFTDTHKKNSEQVRY